MFNFTSTVYLISLCMVLTLFLNPKYYEECLHLLCLLFWITSELVKFSSYVFLFINSGFLFVQRK